MAVRTRRPRCPPLPLTTSRAPPHPFLLEQARLEHVDEEWRDADVICATQTLSIGVDSSLSFEVVFLQFHRQGCSPLAEVQGAMRFGRRADAPLHDPRFRVLFESFPSKGSPVTWDRSASKALRQSQMVLTGRAPPNFHKLHLVLASQIHLRSSQSSMPSTVVHSVFQHHRITAVDLPFAIGTAGTHALVDDFDITHVDGRLANDRNSPTSLLHAPPWPPPHAPYAHLQERRSTATS